MKVLMCVLLMAVGLSFGLGITPQVGVSFPVEVRSDVTSFDYEASLMVGITISEELPIDAGEIIVRANLNAGYIPDSDGLDTFEDFIIPVHGGLRGHVDMFIVGYGLGVTFYDIKPTSASNPATSGYIETGISTSNLEWILRCEAASGDMRLYSLFGFPL